MQLCLDAADRLVELVEEHRGPVAADEAARAVLKLGSAVPVGLARSLLDEAVQADARLRWSGDLVGLAGAPGEELRARGRDLRRLRPRDDRAPARRRPGRASSAPSGCERLELDGAFPDTRQPRRAAAAGVAALTGLRDEQLRRAPPVAAAVRRFLAFAGDAVLVAHNARFDMAFLDNETMRLTGNRVAATVVDTVGLARRLLGRQPANLAALSHRFVTDARPCHRALPDAEATAEILLCADRDGAGARRAHRRRPRRARRDAAAPRAPQAQPRVRRAAAARRLPLPRRARPGALRRPRARPPRAAALVLPLGTPAAGRRGGARRARDESNGACSARSSRRRSRSCA